MQRTYTKIEEIFKNIMIPSAEYFLGTFWMAILQIRLSYKTFYICLRKL